VKLTPQNVEAEASLLGGLIVDPSAVDAVGDVVRPEDFYRPDHGRLFGLLLDMRSKGHHIDEMTVCDRINRGGKADEYGGYAYVVDLPEKCPSRANLPHYARLVREAAVRRRAAKRADDLRDALYAGVEEPEAILSAAAAGLLAELDGGKREDGWTRAGAVAATQANEIQRRQRGGHPGVSTGLYALDDLLNGGWREGQLVVIAARPGVGKTALALTFALFAASVNGVGTGMFSLEMDRGELVERLLAQTALVDASRIRRGDLDETAWNDIEVARGLLDAAPLWMDDRAGLTIDTLRARARRLAATEKVGLLVVDYLQLLTPSNPKANRAEQVGDMSRGLKLLAKELRVPVIALSQLNRDVEKRRGADAKPRLSDLRDSGAVEQDADVIMFISRDEADPTGAAHVLHVEKNRAGRIGQVPVIFEKSYSRFVELEGLRL
jgi:replicative DNA helicase